MYKVVSMYKVSLYSFSSYTYISCQISVNDYFPSLVFLRQSWSRVILLTPASIPRHAALMMLNDRTLNRETTSRRYIRVSVMRRSRQLTRYSEVGSGWERGREKKNGWPPISSGKAGTSSRYRRISAFRNSSTVIDCSLLIKRRRYVTITLRQQLQSLIT